MPMAAPHINTCWRWKPCIASYSIQAFPAGPMSEDIYEYDQVAALLGAGARLLCASAASASWAGVVGVQGRRASPAAASRVLPLQKVQELGCAPVSCTDLPCGVVFQLLPVHSAQPCILEQASDPRVHMQAGDMTRTIRWWSTRFRIWTSPQWPTSAVGTPGQRCGITVSGCPLPSGEAAIMHKVIN